MPLCELAKTTEACGTTAPVGSVTTPESVAVVVAICALSRGALLVRIRASRIAIPPQVQRDCGFLI